MRCIIKNGNVINAGLSGSVIPGVFLMYQIENGSSGVQTAITFFAFVGVKRGSWPANETRRSSNTNANRE